MKKWFFLYVLLQSQTLLAQKYNTVAGLRIGDDFGFSVAQRIANKTTIELNYQPGTFVGKELAAGLIRQHYPLLTKRLNFFVGVGAYYRKNTLIEDVEVSKSFRSSGLACSFGGELTLGNLNISTDFLPLVNFRKEDTHQRFYTTTSISLRYIFVPRSSRIGKFFKNVFSGEIFRK